MYARCALRLYGWLLMENYYVGLETNARRTESNLKNLNKMIFCSILIVCKNIVWSLSRVLSVCLSLAFCRFAVCGFFRPEAFSYV